MLFDSESSLTEKQVLAARLTKAVKAFQDLAADFAWVAKIEERAASVEALLGDNPGEPRLANAAGRLLQAYADENKEFTGKVGDWRITIQREGK